MKKGLIVAMVMLLILTAVGGALAEGGLKKLVVTEPGHLTGYLPLYVAINEGIFAEYGLEVEVVAATGGAHITAVVSGDAFAVIGGIDSMALASRGSQDPIIAIVNCVNRANVYLFAKKGLAPASSSDEDMKAFLKGKTIIAGRYGGSPNLVTRYLLLTLGLDPEKDVTLIENADISTVNAMVEQGLGQIGNGGEPQISQGVTKGIWEEPFFKFPDLGDFSYSCIGVKRSTIENDPETCQKFVSAMIRALKMVHDDRAIAERVMDIEYPTMAPEDKKASLDRLYEDNMWSPDGFISEDAVMLDMDVLVKSGIYEGEYTYDSLVDLSFFDVATAKK